MNELTSRQARALILLLILVPLIPTTLMLRLMFNSIEAERVATEERTHELYRQALHAAGSSLAAHLGANSFPAEELPQRVRQFYERAFDRDVAVRLVDAQGAPLGETSKASGSPVAEVSLDRPEKWRVQLFTIGSRSRQDGLSEPIKVYSWATALALAGHLGIAGVAGCALHQQMRLQELKSSALATVSHELKTPLASMRLLLDTLGEAPQKLRDYLPLLARENARLTRMTENFLALSRFERGFCGPREWVDAPALFEAALESLHFRIEGGEAHIMREVPADFPEVRVDKNALTIALANLIDNALKYTGGAKRITLRALLEGKGVALEVTDNGPGISKVEQRKIFRRFYQVNQKLSRIHEGSGLGLSIVKSIVEAHGGTVRVTSTEGGGSTFRIDLPGVV